MNSSRMTAIVNIPAAIQGKTPVRGVDYFTEEDIDAIVDKVGEEAGAVGKSAYQIAVEQGFIGTEAEWLASLKANVETLSNLELENILK